MHYTGHIVISPSTQKLQCELSIKFTAKTKQSQMILLLHKDIAIDAIVSNNLKEFHIEQSISNDVPFILEAKRVTITFHDALKIGEEYTITMHYHGQIPIVSSYEINRIEETFVELGLYTPWYPISLSLEESTFDITLEIPDDYMVITGYQLKKNNHQWTMIQEKPHSDCSFLAFKNAKVTGNDLIKIYHFPKQTEVAEELFTTATKLIDYFTNTFGEVSSDKHISIALPPRSIGGGYCRDGLIVLALDDTIQQNKSFIAHEIAHLWWNKASVTTWEDWLNESFAEYSALMAVRELYDHQSFQTRMKSYINHTQSLPPIKNIARSSKHAVSVLYKKGPTLLDRLEHAIGPDLFHQLLRQTHENNIDNTDDFLLLIKNIVDEKTMQLFDAWLEE